MSYFSGSHLDLSSYSPKRNSRVREKDLNLYDDFYIDRNTQLDPRDLLFTSQEEKKWEFQYLKEKRGDGFELSDEELSDVKDIQRKIDLSWYLVDLACERGCSYFIFDW